MVNEPDKRRRADITMGHIENTDKAVLDIPYPLDSTCMYELLNVMADRYEEMKLTYIGNSLLGKSIPMVRLGEGEDRQALYVGAHHGCEWLTASVLLRFINEYCEYLRNGRRMYSINLSYLYKSRTVWIIPMLNPDGVDLSVNGVTDDNPLRERLERMSGGDYSHWQANARGVDLNHNYDAGFEEYRILSKEVGIEGGGPTRYAGEAPESEPETAALANFLRFNDKIGMVVTLHSQGEEIFFSSGGKVAPRSRQIARLMSRMTGYKLSEPEGLACYGGLTDWVIRCLGIPSFTIECGCGENPLPESEFFGIYTALREMLFTAPILL